MEQYTRKDAEQAFDQLLRVLGKQRAESYNDVGGWQLDYNPTYGGCVAEEVVNEHGAVTRPLGDHRRKPADFCDAVFFALRVLEKDTRGGLTGRQGV